MADLELQLRPSGKYDFKSEGGDLVRTSKSWPSILRLLLQGPWIGDDGERTGESLPDIKLIDRTTKDKVQRIAETRLAPLIRSGEVTSINAIDVTTDGGRVDATISVLVPGEQPRAVQVPLTR